MWLKAGAGGHGGERRVLSGQAMLWQTRLSHLDLGLGQMERLG